MQRIISHSVRWKNCAKYLSFVHFCNRHREKIMVKHVTRIKTRYFHRHVPILICALLYRNFGILYIMGLEVQLHFSCTLAFCSMTWDLKCMLAYRKSPAEQQEISCKLTYILFIEQNHHSLTHSCLHLHTSAPSGSTLTGLVSHVLLQSKSTDP